MSEFLRKRPKDYGTNWYAQRAAARRRDSSCQRCGVTGITLDVHHKIPIRLWEDKNAGNDLENLICLCRSCHRIVEAATTWIQFDDGSIGSFATGGPIYELAEAKGLLPQQIRKQPPRSVEERAMMLECDTQEHLIALEMSKPPGERNWAAIFDRINNPPPLDTEAILEYDRRREASVPRRQGRPDPTTAQLGLFGEP